MANRKTVTNTNIDLKQIQQELEDLRKFKEEIYKKTSTLNISTKNPLIDKVVKIVPIQKASTTVIKDSSEASMLTKTTRSIVAPIDRNGVIVKVLTDDERLYFEELLNIDLNHLEPDPKKNFWTSKTAKLFFRKLTRNLESASITLDLSKPYDYIRYKVALSNPRVANSWKERYNDAFYEFVIVDENEKIEEELSFSRKEDFVLKKLMDNKLNPKYLLDLLRVFGSNNLTHIIGLNTSREILYYEAKQLTKSRQNVEKLYMLLHLDNKTFENKVFVEDLLSTSLLSVYGTEYQLKGGQIIGYSKEDVIAYFNNPENQSVKLKLKNTLDKLFKEKENDRK